MERRIKRIMSLLMVMVMLLTVFTGCSGNNPANGGTQVTDSSSGGGESKAKDTLTVAIEDDIESLSPFEICTGLSGRAYEIMYEPLFMFTPEGKAEPWLVESYERPSDVEWNFKLKEGVLFHDGTEMTAEDVKASLENAGTYPVPKVHDKTVEVTGKYTFTIKTPIPDALLIDDDLAVKWNSVVPKALLDAGNDFKVNPIGTGPYKFVERATAEYLKFESFDGYRDEETAKGRVKYVILKVIPEPSSRTIALENGEVDMVVNVEAMDVQRLIENPDTEVLETNGVMNFNLTLNTTKPGLDNILVRKAIAYAINPEAVLQVAVNGYGFVSRTTIPPGSLGYTEDGAATYDPEKAREFLSEAGYNPGELSFEFLCYKTANSRAAESMQADLAEIGINSTISNVESAVMIEKTAAGEFDMLPIGNSGINIPYKHINLIYHSGRIGAGNRSFLKDPEIDALIEKIPTVMDEKESEALYKEVVTKIQNSYVVLPLFIDKTHTAYRTGMKNVYRGVDGITYPMRIRFE